MLDLSPFGLALGHATDPLGVTGCTVVRGIDGPFRCCASLLGRASGTRELAVASPEHLVDRVDAILLTGGSAYGLDAAAGVMRWMEAHGRGYDVGSSVVPIVPAAVLFDLGVGDAGARPTPDMAAAACAAASPRVGIDAMGSVGAGTGATVGKALGAAHAMKGGLGVAVAGAGAVQAAAVAVVNALGDVRDAQRRIIAGARAQDGTFVDVERAVAAVGPGEPGAAGAPPFGNTTLCVVASSVAVDRVALAQLARAATAALHRRITPCGTTFDGDVIFAVCPPAPVAVQVPALTLEALAVAALEEAVERAVRHARGLPGIPGLADAG